jgi:hypothetical protein
MRTNLFTILLASALSLGAGAAFAGDKPADKTEKSAKPAAGEVTLNGEMHCAKCTLHEADKCQNVLKVTEGGKETKYYLAENPTAHDNHKMVCKAPAPATVTGQVKEEGGKKVLTASAIKYQAPAK